MCSGRWVSSRALTCPFTSAQSRGTLSWRLISPGRSHRSGRALSTTTAAEGAWTRRRAGSGDHHGVATALRPPATVIRRRTPRISCEARLIKEKATLDAYLQDLRASSAASACSTAPPMTPMVRTRELAAWGFLPTRRGRLYAGARSRRCVPRHQASIPHDILAGAEDARTLGTTPSAAKPRSSHRDCPERG